jgi:hypothetical protein
MSDAIMRALHVPWWVPFIFWFGLYLIYAFYYVVNGYAQEYMGWRHAGRPGKIHKVLVRFHTGAHIQPERSHGDEKRLKRTAGATTRATPEGAMVYWSPHSRRFRALRNNLAVIIILTVLSTMVSDPVNTVRAVTLLFLAGCTLWLVFFIRKLRRKRAKTRPISPKPTARTKPAKKVMEADESTVGATPRLEVPDAKPQLEGVPVAVLAGLLAGRMGCSTAELIYRMTMDADSGRISPLPDTYAAILKDRENIEEIIRAHTKGQVKFSWLTTQVPRELVWEPIPVYSLPAMVRFRDYLDKMERLDQREFGVGVVANRDMYVATHNGDFPWHCRFAGPGTGKTTGFLVKAAQVCHKDPDADVYCVDTKQVSFVPLRGIPGVYIYDKPQSEMEKIWSIWYELHRIMQERYQALSEGKLTLADLNDIWVFIDEGNDLAACLKSYSKNIMGIATAPAIWGEAIAPLMRMGRQARIFGEFMCQDLDGRMFGGETLKTAFNAFGAAGFQPAQLTRTIGGKAEDAMEGPGKILMVKGKKREWVQAFYDEEDYLHDYALVNRKGRRVAA